MREFEAAAGSSICFKAISFGVLAALFLWLATGDYLLFHSLAELFSIIIACGVFILAWNTRRFFDNNYLLFIGIAYLFVAFFDSLHTFAFHGMGVFKGYDDDNLGPQLWLVARWIESVSLVLAPLFFRRRLRPGLVVAAYCLVGFLFVRAIFFERIFPTCFIAGTGLTPFKRNSEYVIDLILLGALWLLNRERGRFEPTVFRLLALSIGCTVVTELFFTVYIHHYGLSNFNGHIFKILSFYFMYKAIIETGLKQPYSLLFRELKQSEEALRRKEESLLLAQRLAHMGSWEWSLTDGRMWWSEEVFAILGHDHDAAPSIAMIVERVHPDDREAFELALNAFRRDRLPFSRLFRICGQGGELRYVKAEVGLRRGEDAQPEMAVGIIHDVTERVKADKMRTDIDRITRHDLKAPLTPIITIPELLLLDGRFPKEQASWIQLIRDSGLRMLEIIDSSLSLYKMEQGTYPFNPEPFDLVPVLDAVLKENDRLVSGKLLEMICVVEGAPLAAGSSYLVYGEDLLCYTMLGNLIKNAIEASPEGAPIRIVLSRTDDWNVIAVENQGEVPEEIRDRFFDQFVTSGKSEGTGLGTYSARLAAQVHKGDIAMQTSPEAGTRITVRLPRVQEKENQAALAGMLSKVGKGATIRGRFTARPLNTPPAETVEQSFSDSGTKYGMSH